MKHLDPKAVWLFFIQGLIGFFILFITFGLIFGISLVGFIFSSDSYSGALPVAVVAGILFLVFLIVFSFIWAKLSYNNYKYELRDDGFRKESGVLFKKYVTVPYERIQNVDIYRGIIARMLGLSDLQIQTAGYSGDPRRGGGAEGRLPALSIQDAEFLRDELIRRSKGQHAPQAPINAQMPQPPQTLQPNQGL